MAEPLKVLFVCIGNTCRSQMAEGFARRYGAGVVEARSAGTYSTGYLNEPTIEAMAEVGVDITSHASEQITREHIDWADMVVTLGCCPSDELCPSGFKGEKRDWKIRDPFGMPPDFMRTVRDEIEKKVRGLIDEKRG